MAAMVAEPPPPPPSTAAPTTAAAPKTVLGKYELGRLLGKGSFAKVYRARSITDDRAVAIKIIDKAKTTPAMEPRIVREVEAMRRLDHPNVLRIHEVMASKSKIYLVMELAKGGDLFSKLARRPNHRFTEPIARLFFHQLVSAVLFCHRSGVAHRDIKPQNLLLDEEGNIKVCDFGLSAVVDPIKSDANNDNSNSNRKDGSFLFQTACGTPAFAAPEIVGRSRLGYDGSKVDAWSCGVILFVLLTGSLPFDDGNLVMMYRKMHKREFKFPSGFKISRAARSLIFRLLDPNPKTRLGMEQIQEDPWLNINQGNLVCSRSVSLGDIASLEEKKYEGREVSASMNAFEIISMSAGLDLSGMFHEKKANKEKRFTSQEPKGTVEEVERREKECEGSCCVALGKGRPVLTTEMA